MAINPREKLKEEYIAAKNNYEILKKRSLEPWRNNTYESRQELLNAEDRFLKLSAKYNGESRPNVNSRKNPENPKPLVNLEGLRPHVNNSAMLVNVKRDSKNVSKEIKAAIGEFFKNKRNIDALRGEIQERWRSIKRSSATPQLALDSLIKTSKIPPHKSVDSRKAANSNSDDDVEKVFGLKDGKRKTLGNDAVISPKKIEVKQPEGLTPLEVAQKTPRLNGGVVQDLRSALALKFGGEREARDVIEGVLASELKKIAFPQQGKVR